MGGKDILIIRTDADIYRVFASILAVGRHWTGGCDALTQGRTKLDLFIIRYENYNLEALIGFWKIQNG